MMMDIRIELTKNPKVKPTDESKLGFGGVFTDHMFLMNYTEGKGWPELFPMDPSPWIPPVWYFIMRRKFSRE